jgi:hypothetical protein
MPILYQNIASRIVYLCAPAGNLHTLDVTCYSDSGLQVMLHTFALR